jgi:PEP phosphonomutase and related enzymes
MKNTTKLKELLKKDEIIIAPGVQDGLSAKIAAKTGFEALYMTGAGVSYTTLGKPDIGLVTMTEMVQKGAYIVEAANLPVIADADTGFGNALNVMRSVKEYEKAGIACIQIEDQVLPKRCGHMAGKLLVSADEMVGKIKAACDARIDEDFQIMARTDARAVEGLEAALERAHKYQEAGADILFIEAPQTIDEMKQLCSEFHDIPLLANMVEGGKTPISDKQALQEIGYKIVIFPGASCRVISKALVELYSEIKNKGTTKGYLDRMYIFNELNALLDLPEIRDKEKNYLPKQSI